MKKVAVTEAFADSMAVERACLTPVGAELVAAACRTEEEVLALARDAVGLIYYYAPVTKRVIEGLDACRVMVRMAIGTDGIEVGAATRKGIMVCNVPDYCIDEVSEHALALMLCLQRWILPLHQAVLKGRWQARKEGPVHRLEGRTLGLLGFGRIARSLAQKASGLGLHIIAHDPYQKQVSPLSVRMVDLEKLVEQSDILSIHVPLTEGTRGMMGEALLKRMKRSAFLVNTGRGAVVDEPALIKALAEGWIAGAGLDVLAEEPPAPDNLLLKMENVIITPHAGFYSEESWMNLRQKAVAEVVRALEGRMPRNVVNPEAVDKAAPLDCEDDRL